MKHGCTLNTHSMKILSGAAMRGEDGVVLGLGLVLQVHLGLNTLVECCIGKSFVGFVDSFLNGLLIHL